MSNNIPSAVSSLGLNNYQVFTSSQMKEYLIERLKKLSNWEDINRVLNTAGTLDLIIDLVASASEVNSFLNLRSQQESFLEFAEINENIFARARELGYRINRYSAPAIVIKYNETPTIEIRRGQTLGKYENYDLIYFESESRIVEKGDLVSVVVGKYGEKSRHFSLDETGDISLEIKPEVLKSIDNNHVVLLYDSIEQDRTLFPEDYIVYNQWCDFSNSTTSTVVQAANFEINYGLFELFQKGVSNSFTVKYIETDGKLVNAISGPNIELDSRFLFYSLGSNGYDCDTVQSIIKNAPLMYSLQRRAVTENDYKFLIIHLPQFFDASISTYKGQLGTYDIRVTKVKKNTNYWISVNELTYAYQNNSDSTTSDDIVEILYEQLKANELVRVTMLGDEGAKYLRLISISTKSLLSVSANKEVFQTLVVQSQKPPAQCTLHIQYVSENTIDEPVPLTAYEYSEQVAPIVDNYKMVGLTLLYEHCKRVEINLKYIITLVDEADKELVNSLINNVINEFDRHTDILIDSSDIGNIIAHHANFKYGRQIISNLVDSKKLTYYVDKSKYCKLNCEIVYVN